MVRPVYDYLHDIHFICGHTERTLIHADSERARDRIAAFASLKACNDCRVIRDRRLTREGVR